jgi:hypothetical protein
MSHGTRFGWLAYALLSMSSAVEAEGVIWELPPDGSWVRLEGTYAQTEVRKDSPTGKIEIAPWIERLWIKSVGEEPAEFQGEMVPCRWLEIKVERGREREGKIDTGLTGLQIYKVLVPTTKVLFESVDDDGVPVGYLPVVKGYRKLGKAEPKELAAPALQLYPLAVLAGYYRDEQIVASDDDPEVGLGAVKADKIQSTVNIERRSSRTVQDTTVWRTKDVPFGIARYDAKIVRETKDEAQSRDDFKPLSEVTISLKAQETGNDAKSELAVP